jgi:hypothetical protein
MSAAPILELQKILETRFPAAVPVTYRTAGSLPSGIEALDAMLPAGGFPRGRVSAWSPGGGATAVLLAACRAAVARGERSAWVDGGQRLTAEQWREGPLLMRPDNERAALVCAEELLRCGGFALVVLAGAEAGRETVRLSRAAREGGSAFVAQTMHSTIANLRLTSRIAPDGYRWRLGPFGDPVEVERVTIDVEAASLGWSSRTRFDLPVFVPAVRMAPEAVLADRRGVVQFAGGQLVG